MKVNIVMLVHERPTLTGQALYTLFRNTPAELFNLTVVADGNLTAQSNLIRTDTLRVFTAGKRDIIWLDAAPQVGVTGRMRNLGIYTAEKHFGRGDFLCLLDNDLYFTPGWLAYLVDALIKCEPIGYRMLGGWNHPYMKPREDPSARYRFANGKRIESHDAVAGACQLVRWETFVKYGPFDAHAKGVGQSEDWKFCQDIIKDGFLVGSIYPRVVLNAGLLNSFGEKSPGYDEMAADLMAASYSYTDLWWEGQLS